MEEHAKSNNKLHSNGEMKCPDELEWIGADGKALDWTCDEAREDGKKLLSSKMTSRWDRRWLSLCPTEFFLLSNRILLSRASLDNEAS